MQFRLFFENVKLLRAFSYNVSMQGWQGFLIVLGVIAALIGIPFIIAGIVSLTKKRRMKRVDAVSPLMKEMHRLNSETCHFEPYTTDFGETEHFHVRRQAVNFDYGKGFVSYVMNHSLILRKACESYERNLEVYYRYCRRAAEIRKSYTPLPEYAEKAKLSFKKYLAIEEEAYRSALLAKHFTEPKVDIGVYYRSPQGRSVYEDEVAFLVDQIIVALNQYCSLEVSRQIVDDNFVIDYHSLNPSAKEETVKLAGPDEKSPTPTAPAQSKPWLEMPQDSTPLPQADSEPKGQESAFFPEETPALESSLETTETPVAALPEDSARQEKKEKTVLDIDLKPSTIVIAKNESGAFVSTDGDEAVFVSAADGTSIPASQLSFYERHALDEALLKCCLHRYKAGANLPLTFDALYAQIQKHFGERAISKDYLSELLHPENPLITKNHLLSCWPDPKNYPGEPTDAVYQFSLDEEQKICRYLDVLTACQSEQKSLGLFILRFFLSYANTLSFDELSDVYSIPVGSIADYLLLIYGDDRAEATSLCDFLFNAKPVRPVSYGWSKTKLPSTASRALFEEASGHVSSWLSSIASEQRFFTQAQTGTILLDGFFLEEIWEESAALNSLIVSSLQEDVPGGSSKGGPIFKKLASLKFPSFDFVFDDYFLLAASSRCDISFTEPYLPLVSSLKAFTDAGVGSPEDFWSLLSRNRYKIKGAEGYAIKSRYLDLADAIYRGKIVENSQEEYAYDNPDKLKKYDDAIKELIDDSYIFYESPGLYKTRISLASKGILDSDLNSFQKDLKSFVAKNPIFTTYLIRKQFADSPVSSFIEDDTVLSRFLRAICHYSQLCIDKETESYLCYTESFDDFIVRFFKKMMAGAVSVTIYEIRDAVLDQYGVTYNLDQIGKDAAKAGLYYSDELEKVYRKKTDYLMEVYRYK
jgi:hypothetical protein